MSHKGKKKRFPVFIITGEYPEIFLENYLIDIWINLEEI